MDAPVDAYAERFAAPLERAAAHARDWLADVSERPIPPRQTADELADGFGKQVPDGPADPAEVVDQLAAAVEPGLLAIGSGRFHGWVMGGTLPAALAADWLVSTWDQNAGMRAATPGVVAAEEAAGRWLLDLLGLPEGADVGFVTGATAANFACLAAARHRVLATAGWDVEAQGLAGAPAVTVLVGAESHASVDLALRYLGLGAPTRVAADAQGRIDPEALAAALAEVTGPVIVCLQAGNLHSGAFDPFPAAIAAARAHGAWVHVDGAFGLWAAASPAYSGLMAGCELADSWATDAHKTLNVPYDCGVAVVADAQSLRGAMGVRTSYLFSDEAGDPLERTPEFSRRARGVPVWAALASLGRSGTAALVEGLVTHAQAIAAGLQAIPGLTVLNDVVWTQVCFAAADDDTTKRLAAAILADGTAWMSGSRWAGRDVIRVSVSNWRTDGSDVERAMDAVRRAHASVTGG